MLHLISFFRKKYPEFVQLALSTVPENTVAISVDGKKYDTSFFHLLYEPQLIGIELPEALKEFEDGFKITRLQIPNPRSQPIELELAFDSKMDCGQTILLFKVIKADLHASWFERWYINRFFKRALVKNNYVIQKFDPIVFDKLLTFFYYPKPVFVISTRSETGNSFPVDTCRKVGDHYIFGVRASNKIMAAVTIGESFAIGFSDFSNKHLVYQLGNYSDAQNPVQYIKDGQTGIMVPEAVSGYQLVTLEEVRTFGNQSVFVARINSNIIQLKQAPFLAHIHKLWLLPKQVRKYYL